MSADSVHHGVEDQIRKQPGGNVYDFSDLCDAFRQSNSGNVEVLVMSYTDFYNFKGEQSLSKLKQKGRPSLADMVEVKFVRGSRSLFFKTDFESSYSEFDFLKKTFQLNVTDTLLRNGPRGIPTAKKTAIVNKLLPLMPSSRHMLWNDIATSDASADLVESFE